MQSRQEQLNAVVFHGAISEDELCVLMRHPDIDLKADDSYVLYRCAMFQFNRALKLAIPLSNPLDQNSRALKEASIMSNVRGVELLLPVSDALANNSEALQNAYLNMIDSINRHIPLKKYQQKMRCFELLYRASDPQAALYGLQQHGMDPTRLQQLETRIAYDLKCNLEQQIVCTGPHVYKKM